MDTILGIIVICVWVMAIVFVFKKSERKTYQNIIIIIAVVLAVLEVYGLTVEKKTPTINSSNYTFESNFMNTCVSGNATYAKCKCTYDYLLSKVGLIGMEKMDKDIGDNPNYTPPLLYEATNACQ